MYLNLLWYHSSYKIYIAYYLLNCLLYRNFAYSTRIQDTERRSNFIKYN